MKNQRALEIEAFNLRKNSKKNGKYTMTATEAASIVGLGTNPPYGWEARGDNKSIKKVSRNKSEYHRKANKQTSGKNTWPEKAPPGFERHHKRMVSLFDTLYKGLDDDEAKSLSAYAASIGIPLGNVKENAEILKIDTHQKMHDYMRNNGMNPSDIPDFSKEPLENRFRILEVLYVGWIQKAVDEELERLKQKEQESPENALSSIQEQFNRSISFKKGFNPNPFAKAGEIISDFQKGDISGAAVGVIEALNPVAGMATRMLDDTVKDATGQGVWDPAKGLTQKQKDKINGAAAVNNTGEADNLMDQFSNTVNGIADFINGSGSRSK